MSDVWFHFEFVSTMLPDRTFVKLVDDDVTVNRWICPRTHSVAAIGPYHALLCELKDGRFLFARYQVHHWEILEDVGAKVGQGSFLEPLHEVPALFAARTLLDWQKDISPRLQAVLSEAMRPKAPPPPRPLEYWTHRIDLSREFSMTDDNGQARTAERELQCLLNFAVDLVQRVRRGFNRDADSHCLRYLGHRLHDRFKVDRSYWDVDTETIPPASIALIEFRDLKDASGVRPALENLVRVFTPVCVAGEAILGPPFMNDSPTWEERELFPAQVNSMLEEFETAVGWFQKAVLAWSSKRASELPPEIKPQRVLPTPETKKQIAWHLYREVGGMTQTQVAEVLMREHEINAEQGVVSRWVDEVDEWKRSQGVNVDTSRKRKPVPIDPKDLDIGQPNRGTTRRQRRKSDEK